MSLRASGLSPAAKSCLARLAVVVARSGSNRAGLASTRRRIRVTASWMISSGVPVIRRYPVRYDAGDDKPYPAPRLDPGGGPPGDYRFADAADLLVPAAPVNDYALLPRPDQAPG